MQEQLRHKKEFNLVRFESRATAWRPRLEEVTEDSLQDAWKWICGKKNISIYVIHNTTKQV